MTENETVGWHHQLNGHEFIQTLGDSEGQGSLVCCSSWGLRVRHDLAIEQQQSGEAPPPPESDCTREKLILHLIMLLPLHLIDIWPNKHSTLKINFSQNFEGISLLPSYFQYCCCEIQHCFNSWSFLGYLFLYFSFSRNVRNLFSILHVLKLYEDMALLCYTFSVTLFFSFFENLNLSQVEHLGIIF